jgi:hypothetical protein
MSRQGELAAQSFGSVNGQQEQIMHIWCQEFLRSTHGGWRVIY